MLLDTSGLLCLFNAAELFHSKSIAAFREHPMRLLQNYVIAEFVALAYARKMPRLETLRFVQTISNDAAIEVIWITEEMHLRGLTLLGQRLDKTYSLVTPLVLNS